MTQITIYTVDARAATRRQHRTHRVNASRVPFDLFYLMRDVTHENLRRIAPFAMVIPLTEAYGDALKDAGLNVKDLMAQRYQVVVPVLMSRAKDDDKHIVKDELQPTYIANKVWGGWKAKSLSKFIPEDVTLSTPNGIINPMCMACDNSLSHSAGNCWVGGPECVTMLRLKQKHLEDTDG